MESVASAIRRIVPELPEEELVMLVNYLKSEGYQHEKDLIYLEIDDLKPHLKLFYARKLLRGLKTSGNDGPFCSSGGNAEQASTLCAESASSSQTSVAAATSTSRRWLQEFKIKWAELPNQLIADCKEGRRPNPQMRRQLVKVLGETVAKHDPMPGTAAVKHIARLVTMEYPKSFADMTSAGDIIGDGAASFSRQLSTFLENKRRPNRNAKRTDDLSEQVDQPAAKMAKGPTDSYGCVAWQPDCNQETWEALSEKRCLLLQTSPPCEDVSRLMAVTYALQRREINEGKVTMQNIRELWPHLLEETYFFGHLDMLVGFSFCEIFIHELTLKGPRIVDYMLKLSRNGMRALLHKVTSAVDKDGQAVPRYFYILELLCAFFGENYGQVVSFHPHAAEGGLEGLPATPHLAVIGSSMGDIKKIIVAVDAVEFISTRSLEKAMGLLLGAFFVFNVAYPPDCPLTMEFSQRYLGQINPTKGRGKGRAGGIAPRLLSLLKAL
nr:uncharacterized protein LOC129384153 isoform X2 [Dermacentor andersoni]XP_054925306.1 uncharacterized protein LOC129384153 isoform X2 [Dermacentor andersoni]